MLHARFAPFAFGFTLSCFMSLIVSGVTTLRVRGMSTDCVELWLHAWLASWALAFPVVLLVAPVTRRIVGRMILSEGV